jgi:hypothetical protein
MVKRMIAIAAVALGGCNALADIGGPDFTGRHVYRNGRIVASCPKGYVAFEHEPDRAAPFEPWVWTSEDGWHVQTGLECQAKPDTNVEPMRTPGFLR